MSRLFGQKQTAVFLLALVTGWGTWLFSGWSQKASLRKVDDPTESLVLSGAQTLRGGTSVSVRSMLAKGTNVMEDTAKANYVWDHSAIHNDLLLARSISPCRQSSNAGLGTVGDLWLQSSNGQQRFIAEAVVCAKFSPDGSNVAYATAERELFIETLTGKVLAQIPRASDPGWRDDSSAVTFIGTPSLDYPELEQMNIYDLDLNQVIVPESAK